MEYLLPHRCKRIGAFAAPLGFTAWLAMQSGWITKLLVYFDGSAVTEITSSVYHLVNVFVATISFLAFLARLYFIAFSREKIEDEMVQRTRLDSFQFAALAQLIVAIAGFTIMIVAGSPREGVLMLFFIVLLFLFWVCFLGRFNYILHVKLRQ